VVYRCAGFGLQFFHGASAVTVANNTVFNNAYSGVYIVATLEGEETRPLFRIRLSTANDLGRVDASCGVPCIDNQLGLAYDIAVVVAGVIGHDQYAVVVAQVFQRRAPELQVILSAFVQHWKEWVVVADSRALCSEQLDDRQGWRFAKIVYILFIGDAQDEHARTVYGFASAIQGGPHRFQHVMWHCTVDLTREFDKSHLEIPLPRLPGKIERIDWYTVPAEAWPRIKRLEPEGFG
jgi:parallel beta-helix repeat protein